MKEIDNKIILKTEGLSKHYGGVKALDKINIGEHDIPMKEVYKTFKEINQLELCCSAATYDSNEWWDARAAVEEEDVREEEVAHRVGAVPLHQRHRVDDVAD